MARRTYGNTVGEMWPEHDGHLITFLEPVDETREIITVSINVDDSGNYSCHSDESDLIDSEPTGDTGEPWCSTCGVELDWYVRAEDREDADLT